MRRTLGVLALLAITVAVVAVPIDAATPNSGYTGKADRLVPYDQALPPAYYGLQAVNRSATPITPGARTGMTSIAGADYEGTRSCSQPQGTAGCNAAQYRAMVFKTSAAAESYWKKACPGCSFRRDQAGWRFYQALTAPDRSQPLSPTNAKLVTAVALCGNLVLAAKGINWGGDARYARAVMQWSIDAAEAAGMSSCDPLKQEPDPVVFARGTAEGRGKAIAAGSIKNPSRIYLRVRTSSASEMYVDWTLTCTNGKRTETTHDEGVAKLPLTIQLPIGISGATRCNATASVVSVSPRNYDVPGTHSIELRSRP
jgi:hypothetical protein